MDKFNIPVVLFLFKRAEKAALILDRISLIAPSKIYLIADGPRFVEEEEEVVKCRKVVEEHIKWECEIIRNYADENRGVYNNIAGGAKWVFEREDFAIFLEDDNMPELSFFQFCQEMNIKYKDDTRILWICGTNYLKKYKFPNNASYYFTQHMMPCGWASWGYKFNKFYDGELDLWEESYTRDIINKLSYYSPLKEQDINNWNRELRRKHNGLRFDSWDYQMSFTLRVHNLYGIVPKYNQIKNIGVDANSIHGGTSFDNVMTQRFCGLSTYPLDFPLVHPSILSIDPIYEKRTACIITLPLSLRLKAKIAMFIKRILGCDPDLSLSKQIRKKIGFSK